ncbi:MAG: ATP-binding cassette domain-containing protein [Oceanospirillaceae bacterium]|nr:ATP-binding cassette domain-containing protein [Oceanospirillaceae bacterium]
MIQTHQLCLNYGSSQILKDINLTFKESGVTSIIGPNGAGKSSLLSLVCRLQKPSSGSVTLHGSNILQLDNAKLAKQLAILRQENHIVSRLTVEDLVCFGRFPYHQGRPSAADFEQINWAIELMELEEFKQRYINELSGGQRQRAYIAMVLAQQTDYLFLDEPLNNLDMKHSVNIMKTLRKAASEMKKSVILVMHDINFAASYSDEIIAMKHGEIIHQDTPENIMTNEVLSNIYDMPLKVEQIHGKSVCLYYL